MCGTAGPISHFSFSLILSTHAAAVVPVLVDCVGSASSILFLLLACVAAAAVSFKHDAGLGFDGTFPPLPVVLLLLVLLFLSQRVEGVVGSVIRSGVE